MKKVSIAGVRVNIEDEEACEGADYIVCASTEHYQTPFLDALRGTCVKCAREVIYRPHSPKRPKKLCGECFTKMAEADTEMVMTTSAKAIAELEELGVKVERDN